MKSSLARPNPRRDFGGRGRPPAHIEHRVNANCDVITVLRDDEVALRKLQAQERLARRECRCLDNRLHSIDCELREILARKAELIQQRRDENDVLTGATP